MDSDKISEEFLLCLGFEVEKLPEPENRKEADFLCKFGNASFLIEAKLKTDNHEALNEQHSVLSKGGVYVFEDQLGSYKQVTNSTLPQAIKQLQESKKHHICDFSFVLLLCYGINHITKKDKSIDQIFGRTFIMDGSDQKNNRHCYYYKRNDFYRYRDDLDGAIIGNIDDHGNIFFDICLNTYSKNYDSLRVNALIEKYPHNILDPKEEHNLGRCYLPDEGIPCVQSQSEYNPVVIPEMLMHLRKKYNRPNLINLDFKSPEFSICIGS